MYHPPSDTGAYAPINFSAIERQLASRFVKEGFLGLADLPDPSTFKDMDRATKRIVQAIHGGEKIILIGDYDVDGVVSTTLMKLFFEEIGVELEWIIPNRFRDGYGLSPTLISRIQEYDLAITVDNGIASVEAAELCKVHQVDLIITDHHLLPERLPDAYAIINQKQTDCNFPYEEVCGAQIAWYLIASLNRTLATGIDTRNYLALVAIAIIADMMPLQHINRTMVIAGLKGLSKARYPAIKSFLERLDRVTLSAEDIAFQIAPVLNSAGRMDDAKWAVAFLLSRNVHDARVRLDRLVGFNEERKRIEQEITKKAMAMVNPADAVIVVAGQGWHEGVVGIVAARLARHYEKPTIVLTEGENGELKGSGRSFHACNLFKITQASRSLLSKFGGHHAAIGLSLPALNLVPFTTALQENYRAQNYPLNPLDPDILGCLRFVEVTPSLIAMMKQYEPYGQGNPRPKFISRGIRIDEVTVMGKEKEHRRFSLHQDGVVLTAVLFKTTERFEVGGMVDLIYTLHENHFNHRITIQLMIEKITPTFTL